MGSLSKPLVRLGRRKDFQYSCTETVVYGITEIGIVFLHNSWRKHCGSIWFRYKNVTGGSALFIKQKLSKLGHFHLYYANAYRFHTSSAPRDNFIEFYLSTIKKGWLSFIRDLKHPNHVSGIRCMITQNIS